MINDAVSSQKKLPAILVLFVLALSVRALVFNHAKDLDFGFAAALKLGDTARHLAEGHGFVWDPLYVRLLNEKSVEGGRTHPRLEVFEEVTAPPYDPSRVEPHRGRPPGYSFILAMTWKVFGHYKFVYSRIIFLILDSLACGLITWIGWKTFGRAIGIGSGLLYALDLPHAVLAMLPGHDAIGSFPIVLALCFFYAAVRTNRWYYFVLAGVAAGVGSLIRQEPYLLPVVLFFSLWPLGRFKRAVFYFLLMQLVVVAVNLPWSIRNRTMFKDSAPFSPSYAANLLAGIGSYPNRWGIQASDVWLKEFVASKGTPYPYHSTGFNRVCMEEFLKIVKEDPLWYAGTLIRRGFRSLSPTILPLRYSYNNYYQKELGKSGGLNYAREFPWQFLLTLLYKAFWYLIWILAVTAIYLGWKKWSEVEKIMASSFLLIPLYYLVSHVPMFTEPRFLLPGYGTLLILASFGVGELAERKKARFLSMGLAS